MQGAYVNVKPGRNAQDERSSGLLATVAKLARVEARFLPTHPLPFLTSTSLIHRSIDSWGIPLRVRWQLLLTPQDLAAATVLCRGYFGTRSRRRSQQSCRFKSSLPTQSRKACNLFLAAVRCQTVEVQTSEPRVRSHDKRHL